MAKAKAKHKLISSLIDKHYTDTAELLEASYYLLGNRMTKCGCELCSPCAECKEGSGLRKDINNSLGT